MDSKVRQYLENAASEKEIEIYRLFGNKVSCPVDYLEEMIDCPRASVMKTIRDSPLFKRDGNMCYILPSVCDKELDGSSKLVLTILELGVFDPTRGEYPQLYAEYKALYNESPPMKPYGNVPYPLLAYDSFTATYRKLRRTYFFNIDWR
jgi:hypothetical protein